MPLPQFLVWILTSWVPQGKLESGFPAGVRGEGWGCFVACSVSGVWVPGGALGAWDAVSAGLVQG